MTKKFMEASIGIFFLTLSGVIIFVGIATKSAIKESVTLQQEQVNMQKELMKSANETKEVATEIAYAFFARTLESENLMTPSDANKIVTEAIDVLSSKSEKLGLFAKALNDAYIKKVY